jgi:flavin-dependent dehydrogenase
MRHVLEYSQDGGVHMKVPLDGPNKLWQHPWQLVQRARLHEALKKTATSLGAVLYTSSKVLEVDPETATLMLEDGKEINVDVIVGADGIYVSGLVETLLSHKVDCKFSRKLGLPSPVMRVSFSLQEKPLSAS